MAHEAAGGREEGLDGRLGEEGPVQAGEAKAVLEIEAGVVAVQPRQGVADRNSLGEGLEMCQAQLVSKPRLPGEKQGEAALAVPFEVGQLGQQGEQIGPEVMRLVDHEKDREVPFLYEADDLLLDGAETEGPGPVGLQAELQGELAEEVGGVDGGVVEIDGPDLLGVERIAQAAQGRGLARAGLAGEKAEAAGPHQVLQTRVQLVRKSSPKRVVSLRRTRGRTGPWDQAAAVMSVGRVAVPGLAKAA